MTSNINYTFISNNILYTYSSNQTYSTVTQVEIANLNSNNKLTVNSTSLTISNNSVILTIQAPTLTQYNSGSYYLNANGSWVIVSGNSSGIQQVNTGLGLIGGPITNTGTIDVLANNGIIANSTGVFVNTTYIATLAANSATYLGGNTAAGLVAYSTAAYANAVADAATDASTKAATAYSNAVSTAASGAAAIYQTTAGLAANVLTLTANSANYINANNGIVSNSSGVFVLSGTGTVVNSTGVHVNSTYIATLAANSTTYVLANNGIVSNSSGVFVLSGTGTVVNATGVHVNSSYIATLAANSTTYVLANNGIVSNSSGVFVNSTYIATLAANSATYLGSSINSGNSTGVFTTGIISVGNSTVNVVSSNGTLALSGSYVSPVQSFRNKIINGNFDFWQRSTSNTTSGYIADRWVTSSLGSTFTTSRQSFTAGQTDVPNEPTYYHRTIVTSSAGASNFAGIYQRIEDVRTLAGKTMTLSFYAKADASKNIAIEIAQYFGTGGSSDVYITPTTCALTTSWQKFTITATFASISGKTIGTGSALQLLFWFDAGSTWNSRTNTLGQQSGTFDIAQVQLEEGKVATPFEIRPVQVEFALCQRYFAKQNALARFYASAAGEVMETPIYFPVPMRITPSGNLISGGARTNISASYPQAIISTNQNARYVIVSNTSGDCYAIDDIVWLEAEL